MGLDDKVGGRVGDAGEKEALLLLLIIKEGSLLLVDGTFHNPSHTGAAGPGAARVGQIQPRHLCRIQDVGIVGGFNLYLLIVRGYYRDLVDRS